MLAQKEETAYPAEQEPIYLPPPVVVVEPQLVPKERSARIPEEPTARPVRQAPEPPRNHVIEEPTPRPARQAPEPPRSRPVVEPEQRAQFVPAPPVQPKQSAAPRETTVAPEPSNHRPAGNAPRVFDYKKQPVVQARTKQTVTRVQKGTRDYEDDEE